jgi:hypothetical protein
VVPAELASAEADPSRVFVARWFAKSIGSLCKTGKVLRAGDQIFAARWEEWGFSRGFWGEIFRDFFAEWWRKMITGAQRAPMTFDGGLATIPLLSPKRAVRSGATNVMERRPSVEVGAFIQK